MGLNVIFAKESNKELALILKACEENFGIKSAQKLRTRIFDALHTLSNMPQMGSQCEGLKELGPLRSYYVPNQTKIIYYADDTNLYIILFWNTRRNPQSLIQLITTKFR